MWQPASTPNLTALVRRECSVAPSSVLEPLLDRLSAESDSRVFVVVSMGGVWFTTAASYSESEGHNKVFVASRPDALLLSVVPPRSSAATYGFRCVDVDAVLQALRDVFGEPFVRGPDRADAGTPC
jgi:hypothetical protein